MELYQRLAKNGWQVHNETFLTKILMRINKDHSKVRIPLLTQLYENKKPNLIMTYQDKKNWVSFRVNHMGIKLLL